MQKSKLVLVWVCVLAVAFAGGAGTYAQMSDTERAQVSAEAGVWTTTPEEDVCTPDTILHYKSQGANDFVLKNEEEAGTANILVTFMYDKNQGQQIDEVTFTTSQPITKIRFAQGSFEEEITYAPPGVTQDTIDASSFPAQINDFYITCGSIENTGGSSSASSFEVAGSAVGTLESTNTVPTATPKPPQTTSATPTTTATETTDKPSSTPTETTTQTPTKTTVETSSASTENGTKTPTNGTETPTTTPTETPTPTETTTQTSTETTGDTPSTSIENGTKTPTNGTPTETPTETTTPTPTAEPTETTNTTPATNESETQP